MDVAALLYVKTDVDIQPQRGFFFFTRICLIGANLEVSFKIDVDQYSFPK